MEKPEEPKIPQGIEKTIEQELTPEVIEKIMAKVQDIDFKDTAYHTLRYKGLEDILSKGILGQKFSPGEKRRKWRRLEETNP